MDGEDKDNPITVEVASPQILRNNQPIKIKWVEANKTKVMERLTFQDKDKDWEDLIIAIVLYISAPMFITSVAFTNINETISKLLIATILIVVIIIGSVATWMIKVIPESTLLVLARLLLIGIGIVLGAVR